MSNFEYIIASLPFLTADYKYADGQGFGDVVAEIRENLSERDAAEMDFLLKGFDGDALDADFYAEALAKGNRFLREYFRFDLNLRNAKVRYLNRALHRDPEQDLMTGEGTEAASSTRPRKWRPSSKERTSLPVSGGWTTSSGRRWTPFRPSTTST